jgi:hypothetical protein
MVLYLCVLILLSLHQESLKQILVDEPLPKVVLSQNRWSFCFTFTRPLWWCHVRHPPSFLHQFWGKTGKPYPDLLHDEARRRILTRILTPSSSAHRFWGANWQTSSHMILRPKSRNRRDDFEAQITKLSTLVLRHKPRNCRSGFEVKPLTNRHHRFWG